MMMTKMIEDTFSIESIEDYAKYIAIIEKNHFRAVSCTTTDDDGNKHMIFMVGASNIPTCKSDLNYKKKENETICWLTGFEINSVDTANMLSIIFERIAMQMEGKEWK